MDLSAKAIAWLIAWKACRSIPPEQQLGDLVHIVWCSVSLGIIFEQGVPTDWLQVFPPPFHYSADSLVSDE
jgi:hypothetical protein